MVDVVIITYNEILNLPHCLRSLQGWTRSVFVVDSGSTDGTQDAARELGAEVIHHDWPGYAQQRNWALAHLPIDSPWVLVLDADESVPEKLRDQITAITSLPVEQTPENGFFINRLTYFLGKPIRHCGYFPSWNMRLFKRGSAQYEDRLVHEHMIIDDPVGYIREPMVHHDRRGLEHYYAKHNRYSTLEATELYREHAVRAEKVSKANLSADARKRRWLKRRVMRHLPWPGIWRFLYMYVVCLGFLDGKTGYRFCLFIANYDAMVAFKLKSLLSLGGDEPTALALNGSPPALATPEGEHPTAAAAPHPAIHHDAPTQTQPESSPWPFHDKVKRAIWMLIGKPLFRFSFHNWYSYRNLLLRLFGARIGRRVSIRPSVNIEIPWMLSIEDDASIGDHAIVYCLGNVHIGKRSIVSQYAHLCAGTHDYTDHTFKLLRTPITIGDDCWIGADAFVGPGVTVGDLSVVGARSSVYKDMPPGKVCVGNPAKIIKDRILR